MGLPHRFRVLHISPDVVTGMMWCTVLLVDLLNSYGAYESGNDY